MLKKITIVVSLGVVGLGVGVAVTPLAGPRYLASGQITLPAHTREANAIVAKAKGQHPGVRLRVLAGHFVWLTATGSFTGSENAVHAAILKLVRYANGKVIEAVEPSVPHRLRHPLGNALHYGAIGLLAGLAPGLAIVAYSRRRGRGTWGSVGPRLTLGERFLQGGAGATPIVALTCTQRVVGWLRQRPCFAVVAADFSAPALSAGTARVQPHDRDGEPGD